MHAATAPRPGPRRGNDPARASSRIMRRLIDRRRAALATSPPSERTERLAAIDAALTRLAEDAYGRCTICDATIAPARLEALPEAAHCERCDDASTDTLT